MVASASANLPRSVPLYRLGKSRLDTDPLGKNRIHSEHLGENRPDADPLGKKCLSDIDHLWAREWGHGRIVCHKGGIVCHRDNVYRRSLLDGWSGGDGDQTGARNLARVVTGRVAQIRWHCVVGCLGYWRVSSSWGEPVWAEHFPRVLVDQQCRGPLPRSGTG